MKQKGIRLGDIVLGLVGFQSCLEPRELLKLLDSFVSPSPCGTDYLM